MEHQTPPSPMQPVPQQPIYYYDPRKSKSTAIILEILPGLFGFFGIGWLYIGQVMPGLILLIGGLVWVMMVIVAAALTGFLACFCTVPITLIGPLVSTLILNQHIGKRPDLYR